MMKNKKGQTLMFLWIFGLLFLFIVGLNFAIFSKPLVEIYDNMRPGVVETGNVDALKGYDRTHLVWTFYPVAASLSMLLFLIIVTVAVAAPGRET